MNNTTVAPIPVQDPLTSRDRRIISEIVGSESENIRTIWIEAGITVWVQFVDGGRLAFDRNWFAKRVQQVKATLEETLRERNDRLAVELEQACAKLGLYHGQIDWLSFSTKLYQEAQLVGFVGYSLENGLPYSRPHQYGPNRFAQSLEGVIALLVKKPVAA
jgi:hypothetical protein